jgi:TolB protein
MFRQFVIVCALGLVTACGGETPRDPTLVPLPTGRTAHDDPSFSPDGRHLVFTNRVRSDDQVWISDADGRNARAISQLAPDVNDPSWSPDGSTIVYIATDSTGGQDLFSVQVAGGRPVRLTRLRASVEEPKYSPDGTRILFASNHSGRWALWTIPSAGGEPAKIGPDAPGEVFNGRWSPDGTRIGMHVDFEAGKHFVAVLDVASGTVTRLTTEGAEALVDWSPDGRELTYVSDRTGQPDIWVVPATGGAPRQLTVDVRADFGPTYSPDGRWIAYASMRGGQQDLWVIPAAGGESRRVTNSPAAEFAPIWTKNGDGLVFGNNDQAPAIYTVPMKGGSPHRLTAEGDVSLAPELSPDGRTVVYRGLRGGLSGLYLRAIDGGGERPLVTGSNNDSPTWSPDGSMVAFTSYRELLPAIWVVRVEGGEQWQVSPAGAQSLSPQWSRDGSRILFLEGPGDSVTLMTAPVRGGPPTRLMIPRGFAGGAWSPDGKAFVLTQATGAGRALGVYRVPSAGGDPVLLTAGQNAWSVRPRWSSDGKQIAYTVASDDGGSADIFVMAADGSGKRRLTKSAAQEYAPTWSADDSEIFFRKGLLAMDAVSLATGEIRSLFDGDLRVSDWSFSPDRSTLVIQARIDRSGLVMADVRELLRAKR